VSVRWLTCGCRERSVCRRAGSGVDANANPGTWIACNQTARCNRGAETWPYRPKGTAGPESRDCIPGWWTWPYRPEFQGAALEALRDLTRHVFVNLECHGAKRGAAFAFWGLVRGRRSRICGLHAFASPLRFRPVGPVPSAWHAMPGHASPSAVALQGQFLVRYRRERGGTRGVFRVGAMVDLWVPRAHVCRRAGSGVDANANPGTWIACNQTAQLQSRS
jgi:hypothetical protein